ncbi:uncharacterized protein LOC105703598 [Orussus abietinus]|uniref:uncharacterized protein LOC105703598 n=1 Tax=Orussus abietinus TaxID=222816 RepID=UPI000626E234|nr:uncharacterized protein LOC105703598 [Orussus abietinus]
MTWTVFTFALAITLVKAGSVTPLTPQEDALARFESQLARSLEEVNAKDSIGIFGDMVTLEKVPVKSDGEIADPEKDPLIRKVEDFFRSRRIRVSLPDDGSSADLLGRALGEKDFEVELGGLARGASEARTKLKRIILPVLLALKLKALIVLPIVITLIGLIGIKGLGAGLTALLLSGAVALKALLTPPPSYPARVSYGIVKPHDIHHDHWHRSQEEVNQPYRGWPEYPDQYPYQDIP